MKQIVAIVRPIVAEKVVEALQRAPLEALLVREVKGFGRQKEYLHNYSDNDYSQAFLPKVEISMWVEDSRVNEVIGRVEEAACTGRMGDGKIIVLPVQEHIDVIDMGRAQRPVAKKRG